MKKIFLGGNDFTLVRHMQNRTGAPALGLALTAFLSASKDGATIHAALSKSLVEGTTVGSYREYAQTIPAADLITHLTAYAGKVIFDRCEGASYDDYEPVQVVAARPAGE